MRDAITLDVRALTTVPLGWTRGRTARQTEWVSAVDHRPPHELWITGDQDADHLLTVSGNALLLGMVLDQQFR